MSTTLWIVVFGTAAVTFVIKAAGPVAFGGRDLPARFALVVTLLAPSLLAALVVTSALADGEELHVGADTAGVAAAGVAIWRGASIVWVIAVAAGVTAGLRAV